MAKLYDLPVATVMKVVEAVDTLRSADAAQVCAYTGLSITTVRHALAAAQFVGLVKEENRRYSSCADMRVRGSSEDGRRSLFRKKLQATLPFELVCELLLDGNDVDSAIRKTAVILGDGWAGQLKPLLRWGRECSILEESEDGQLGLAKALAAGVAESKGIPATALSSDIEARLFIGKTLGQDCYAFLEPKQRERFSEALVGCQADPEGACESVGKAMEDYLRLIALRNGVDASKANGIEQVAQNLREGKVILSKHMQLCAAVNALRIASAHDKDKETGLVWSKTAETALLGVLLALRTIRSIHIWVEKHNQEL